MDQYGTDVFSDVPNHLETSGCPKPPQFLSVLGQWALLSLHLALTRYSFCLFFSFYLQVTTGNSGADYNWLYWWSVYVIFGPYSVTRPRTKEKSFKRAAFQLSLDKAEMSLIVSKILKFLILISCHCKFSPYHSCLITVFHYLSSMTFRWMAMFPFCFNNDEWLYDIFFKTLKEYYHGDICFFLLSTSWFDHSASSAIKIREKDRRDTTLGWRMLWHGCLLDRLPLASGLWEGEWRQPPNPVSCINTTPSPYFRAGGGVGWMSTKLKANRLLPLSPTRNWESTRSILLPRQSK